MKNLNATFEEFFDPQKQFYNEQFRDFFSNDEPDAATAPYYPDRQALLAEFLTYAEVTIDQAADILAETKAALIEDIKDLKSDLPVSTKQTVVSRLSNIARAAYKASVKLFHDVFDVLKKDMIKKALYEGYDQVHPYFSECIKWIQHQLPHPFQ